MRNTLRSLSITQTAPAPTATRGYPQFWAGTSPGYLPEDSLVVLEITPVRGSMRRSRLSPFNQTAPAPAAMSAALRASLNRFSTSRVAGSTRRTVVPSRPSAHRDPSPTARLLGRVLVSVNEASRASPPSNAAMPLRGGGTYSPASWPTSATAAVPAANGRRAPPATRRTGRPCRLRARASTPAAAPAGASCERAGGSGDELRATGVPRVLLLGERPVQHAVQGRAPANRTRAVCRCAHSVSASVRRRKGGAPVRHSSNTHASA